MLIDAKPRSPKVFTAAPTAWSCVGPHPAIRGAEKAARAYPAATNMFALTAGQRNQQTTHRPLRNMSMHTRHWRPQGSYLRHKMRPESGRMKPNWTIARVLLNTVL